LEYLTETQVQTKVAQRIVKDAHLEGIPLVADVEQERWSLSTIVVRHYDYGKDLTLSEIRVIQQLARVAAAKCGCELHFTLETLRFSVIEFPKEEGAPAPDETDKALDAYLRLCQPFSHLWREAEDITAEWRYLKWPINCKCN